MFPRSQPLYFGKPKPGTKLIKPDSGINRSCKGAWLLGDGRNGHALWLDSSKSRLDASGAAAASNFNGGILEPGRFGGSVAYRSKSSIANFLSTANYTPPSSGFTVNIWVYPYSWVGFHPLITQWNENSNQRSWAVVGDSSHIYAYASSNGTNFRQYNTNSAISARNWTMVTAVYQGGGTSILLYINGALASTTTSGDEAYGGINSLAQPVYIGYSPKFGGGTVSVEGRLEAATIDERILSADEIALMYRSQYARWERGPGKKIYRPITANTITGSGTMGFAGISFSGAGATTHIKGDGNLAFQGISFNGVGNIAHIKGTGNLAFNGISIVGQGFNAGVPGAGLRQFWTC